MSGSQDQWLRIQEFALAFNAGNGMTLSPDEQKVTDNPPTVHELTAFGIHTAYDAYLGNRWRLRRLAISPIDAFCHGEQLQKLRADHAEELSRGRSFDEIVREWLARPRFSFSSVDLNHVASMFASEMIFQSPECTTAFCGSLVIQAWTMFECIAEDLWDAASTTHPRIAELKGQAEEDEKFPESVRNLWKQKAPKFRTLLAIIVAYRRGFYEDSDSIRGVVENPRLAYLAAVRNLLVHKAGNVDEKFIEQISQIPGAPQCDSQAEGYPLHGRIAAYLCDSAVLCSASLVRSVCEWLKTHPCFGDHDESSGQAVPD